MNAIVPPAALLPQIETTRTTLRMFGTYAMQKNLSVRLDLIYDRYHSNDWTYTNFTYADGTTAANPNVSSTFLGVSVVYRFQ